MSDKVVLYPITLTTWFDEEGGVAVIKPDEVATYKIDPVAVVYEELAAYPLTNNPCVVGDEPTAIPNIPVLLPVELAFASDHVPDELRKYSCPVVSVPAPNLTISPLNAGDVGGVNINEPLTVNELVTWIFCAESPRTFKTCPPGLKVILSEVYKASFDAGVLLESTNVG